jgi:thioredoxin-like negative regulator of GroEL
MRTFILYHPNSDHARAVEQFAHDFRVQQSRGVELVSLETREGSDLATLYGIMNYPSIVSVMDNGQLLKQWEGLPPPLMNEVAAYAE